MGPVKYVINASYLHPIIPLNKMGKYADDSYLMIPSINSGEITTELEHIARWAAANNLTLNATKTKEMVIYRPRGKKCNPPPPASGITRVENMNVLGVTLHGNLSVREHVEKIVSKCSQGAFALRTLKAHGLNGAPLWQVAEATLVSAATYASQAWWGLTDAGCRQQLDQMIHRLV